MTQTQIDIILNSIYRNSGVKQLEKDVARLSRMLKPQLFEQWSNKLYSAQNAVRSTSVELSQLANVPLSNLNSLLLKQNTMVDKTGRLHNILTGQYKKEDTVVKGLKSSSNRFRMELLSIMFFSMGVAAAINTILGPAFDMVGVWEILNTLLGVIFLPVALAVLDVLLPLALWFASLDEPTRLAVGTILLLVGALASIAAMGSAMGLGIAGWKQFFDTLEAANDKGFISIMSDKLGLIKDIAMKPINMVINFTETTFNAMMTKIATLSTTAQLGIVFLVVFAIATALETLGKLINDWLKDNTPIVITMTAKIDKLLPDWAWSFIQSFANVGGAFGGLATPFLTTIGKFATDIGLATGGIVTSPTLATIGESGPEAVIPLSQMGNMMSFSPNITIYANSNTDIDYMKRQLSEEWRNDIINMTR